MEDNNFVISLADRVKHQIYDDFERLKRQGAICINVSSRNKRIMGYRIFREKYYKFYLDIVTLNKYKKLSEPKRKHLRYYFKHLDKINNLEVITRILEICREAVEKMGISKIDFSRDNTPF